MTHSSGQPRITSPFPNLFLHNPSLAPYLLAFSLTCSFSPSVFCCFFFSHTGKHNGAGPRSVWLDHFPCLVNPAEDFMCYLLSCFHHGSVTKQRHGRDEKERRLDGGQSQTWRRQMAFESSPSDAIVLPLSFFFDQILLKSFFFFFLPINPEDVFF